MDTKSRAAANEYLEIGKTNSFNNLHDKKYNTHIWILAPQT